MPKLPDWWEPHRVHLHSRPSPEGLRAVVSAVSPGARIERVRRLGGGISTATSAIRLRPRSGSTLDVVLKRFPGAGAREEWQRLVYAQRLPVPTPEPLALDARGAWFGASALVMRKLPGRPHVRPVRLDEWLSRIAHTQIQIHSASTSRIPALLTRPMYPDGWKPPEAIPRTQAVDEAVTKVRRHIGRAIRREVVVAHGDSHPGNLLWSRGRVSGIIDWRSARLAPRGYEVAYMRADLAVLLGLRAADAYREAYEQILGAPVADLGVWDVVCGLNAQRWSFLWVLPYREQGADLTTERARRHALAFIRRASASL